MFFTPVKNSFISCVLVLWALMREVIFFLSVSHLSLCLSVHAYINALNLLCKHCSNLSIFHILDLIFLHCLHRNQHFHLFNVCLLFYDVAVFMCVCVCRPLRCLLTESRWRMMQTGYTNEPKTWSSLSRTRCWELKVAEELTSPPAATSKFCQHTFFFLCLYPSFVLSLKHSSWCFFKHEVGKYRLLHKNKMIKLKKTKPTKWIFSVIKAVLSVIFKIFTLCGNVSSFSHFIFRYVWKEKRRMTYYQLVTSLMENLKHLSWLTSCLHFGQSAATKTELSGNNHCWLHQNSANLKETYHAKSIF